MKTVATIPLLLILLCSAVLAEAPDPRLAGLDAYWAEVSRSVKEGDFAAYAAGCHAEAVLVSGSKKMSQPLSTALARWKKEFDDTKAGTRSSEVTFRFTQRFGDESTAHESGIFLYAFKQGEAGLVKEYIHFEVLLVKREDGWKTLMEYQKSPATEAEWDALK